MIYFEKRDFIEGFWIWDLEFNGDRWIYQMRYFGVCDSACVFESIWYLIGIMGLQKAFGTCGFRILSFQMK